MLTQNLIRDFIASTDAAKFSEAAESSRVEASFAETNLSRDTIASAKAASIRWPLAVSESRAATESATLDFAAAIAAAESKH